MSETADSLQIQASELEKSQELYDKEKFIPVEYIFKATTTESNDEKNLVGVLKRIKPAGCRESHEDRHLEIDRVPPSYVGFPSSILGYEAGVARRGAIGGGRRVRIAGW